MLDAQRVPARERGGRHLHQVWRVRPADEIHLVAPFWLFLRVPCLLERAIATMRSGFWALSQLTDLSLGNSSLLVACHVSMYGLYAANTLSGQASLFWP